jgi:hypothetical protein
LFSCYDVYQITYKFFHYFLLFKFLFNSSKRLCSLIGALCCTGLGPEGREGRVGFPLPISLPPPPPSPSPENPFDMLSADPGLGDGGGGGRLMGKGKPTRPSRPSGPRPVQQRAPISEHNLLEELKRNLKRRK